MTEPRTKREQQREERRKQILDAALVVFGEKGFHASNVSDVAAQAGVSQGTIYWYFDSKDELLSAAILAYVDDLASEMMALTLSAETAAGKLHALADGMGRLAESGARFFTMVVEFWASSPHREQAATMWLDVLAQYQELLVGLVGDGIRSGEFRQIDAEGVVWAIMAAYDGLAAYYLLKPDLDVARASRAFTNALLEGLLAQRGAGVDS
jgi:AcrR family transcriptional regulator